MRVVIIPARKSSKKIKTKLIGYVVNDYETCDIDNKSDLIKAKKIFKKIR